MWEEPGGATLGQIPRSFRLGRTPEWELLRADPRYRRGSSRFTYGAELSPDSELGDEGAIALDVGVPQVVQQTPLLADQEKEAAARVVVFGVRLQVLGELLDARVRKGDLHFGGTRVLVRATVFRDQLALDFVLYCQTQQGSIRGDDYLTYSTLPSERGSAAPRHFPGPSTTIACAWPNQWCREGMSFTRRSERAISAAPG